jgi:hypothetical protein
MARPACKKFMNLPCPGGFLLFLLLLQDPPAPRPDLVARYARILEKGPDHRRDLATRALLSLGRSGHAALRRADLPPAIALVRLPAIGDDDSRAREAVRELNEDAIRRFGTLAEPFLWEALDTSPARAASLLRALYSPPDAAPPGRPSAALKAELDRRRDFDVTDRPLSELLNESPLSWILLSPRDERISLKLRGVSLRDFLRAAAPKLAAVPEGDLLILAPAERIASAEPGSVVWAPSDLVPKIEAALEGGPVDGLTGVGAYHALRCAGPAFAERASAMRKQLAQRVYFVDAPADDGPAITLSPTGNTQATLAAFEKAAGFPFEAVDSKPALGVATRTASSTRATGGGGRASPTTREAPRDRRRFRIAA